MVEFVRLMVEIEKRISAVTTGGKLTGITFYGKMRWGHDPCGVGLGKKILEGWSRVYGRMPRLRHPISIGLLRKIIWKARVACASTWEIQLFRALFMLMLGGLQWCDNVVAQ